MLRAVGLHGARGGGRKGGDEGLIGQRLLPGAVQVMCGRDRREPGILRYEPGWFLFSLQDHLPLLGFILGN